MRVEMDLRADRQLRCWKSFMFMLSVPRSFHLISKIAQDFRQVKA
jgi:hypothetical protein